MLQKRVALHASLLYNSRFKPEAYLISAVFMLFHRTLMVFTVQERQLFFFFTTDGSYRFLYAQNVNFLSHQHYEANGKRSCAHRSTFSPFPRCFTMLSSEGKRTIAKALKSSLSDQVTNSSLEVRWKSWIDALVEGGKSEHMGS
jgi:hypothetical protein